MKKLKEYKLLAEHYSSTEPFVPFEEEVNKLLKEGWDLHGETQRSNGWFSQAFTRDRRPANFPVLFDVPDDEL